MALDAGFPLSAPRPGLRERLAPLAAIGHRLVDPRVFGGAATRRVIARQYLAHTGVLPDLENPRDLAEKIQWLKLHDFSPLHVRCADRIQARDYVASRVGPEILVPLLLTSRDPRDISPGRIPQARFVVKTTHDQGGVFLCRDRRDFDWQAVRDEVARRMRRNYFLRFREPQYKPIRPGILVEALLECAEGGDPADFKVFCFHGRPEFVQVDLNRHHERRQAFYDTTWTRLPVRAAYPPLEGEIPAPQAFARMLECAGALSAPFRFCRVDLYEVQGEVRFGEITFHPGAGLARFEPPAWERAFGDLLDLTRAG